MFASARGPACLLVLALALAACAAPPGPGPDAPLLEGLGTLGSVEVIPGRDDRLIVFIRDRHATHGAITLARGTVREVQRENHAALRFLLAKGLTLLGCESARGPLPDGPVANAHRDAVRAALAAREDPDELTVYQPIRYAVQYEGRLDVVGVEDPDLYAADTLALQRSNDIAAALRRGDPGSAESERLKREHLTVLMGIRRNARERGRRAAANLVAEMETRGERQAMLLLGGAHLDGVRSGLEEAGVTCVVFEAPSYRGDDS